MSVSTCINLIGLAWKQLARHRLRTLLTVLGVAAGMFLFTSVETVQRSLAEATETSASDTVLVELDQGQSVGNAIVEISAQPGVAYVEPDYRVQAVATSDDTYYTGGSHWGMYGNGTTPANQYGSGAGEAWAQGYAVNDDKSTAELEIKELQNYQQLGLQLETIVGGKLAKQLVYVFRLEIMYPFVTSVDTGDLRGFEADYNHGRKNGHQSKPEPSVDPPRRCSAADKNKRHRPDHATADPAG